MPRPLALLSDGSDRLRVPSGGGGEPVVELGVFLPREQAEGLIALSRRRGESVGQLLRSMIARELGHEVESRRCSGS